MEGGAIEPVEGRRTLLRPYVSTTNVFTARRRPPAASARSRTGGENALLHAVSTPSVFFRFVAGSFSPPTPWPIRRSLRGRIQGEAKLLG